MKRQIYVLCRSAGRVEKEHAMGRRALRAFVRDLIKLRLEERHRPKRRFLLRYELREGRVQWEWDRDKWRAAVARDGACPPRSGPPTSSWLLRPAQSGLAALAYGQPISRLPSALDSPKPRSRSAP
jgi:hypothetical protein